MTIQLTQLIYDPKRGGDVAASKDLNYNPDAYHTPKAAAHGFYDAIVEYARKHEGYNDAMVESEIRLWNPERAEQYSGSRVWCVVWEGGPHEWAIRMMIGGSWGHCEPYYGFDLHFYGN
jgi:hypothetical protein